MKGCVLGAGGGGGGGGEGSRAISAIEIKKETWCRSETDGVVGPDNETVGAAEVSDSNRNSVVERTGRVQDRRGIVVVVVVVAAAAANRKPSVTDLDCSICAGNDKRVAVDIVGKRHRLGRRCPRCQPRDGRWRLAWRRCRVRHWRSVWV